MLNMIVGCKYLSVGSSTRKKSMTGAVKVFLICCLLQGSSCENWAAFMPTTVEGLRGSCAIVPCTFSLPTEWDKHLDNTCEAIWNPGSSQKQVNLIGNLLEKNCTTIFSNLPLTHSRYQFRLECKNALKFTFAEPEVIITTRDSMPKPTITPSFLEVEEGTPVKLNCSAVATCPILPPNLTWTPSIGDVEESTETKFKSSAMNFTASYVDNGQTFSCAALYEREADHSDLHYENSLTLHVVYPPINTSVRYSGPVNEGSSVTLTCDTNANPAVDSYTWYRVNGGQVTEVGSEKILSTEVSEVNRQFYCQVSNSYGSQNSSIAQIDVQFSPKETAVVIDSDGPILEGSSVTLFCSSRANPPVTNYTWYKDGEEDRETGSTLVINDVNPSHNGAYHCAAKNEIGGANSAVIQLDIQYPPKNTLVSVDPSDPVLDGSSVTLTCTSIANPEANFTWFREAGGQKETVSSGRDLTFNVTKPSGDQYYCEALNVHGAESSEPVSLDVTFAAEILSSSHCAKIFFHIQCSCNSQGNPIPTLVWELAGEPVNHSADIAIEEVPLGSMSIQSLITLYRLDEDKPSLVCLSNNSLGSDHFVFNLPSSDTLGLDAVSLMIGFAVGALGMMLVCAPLLFIYRKRKSNRSTDKELVDTSVTNETNSLQVDVIYANKTILRQKGEVEEDPIHYATVDFAKLQAKSEGRIEEGEVRGLASMTSEYAQIHLHSRGSNGRDAK